MKGTFVKRICALLTACMLLSGAFAVSGFADDFSTEEFESKHSGNPVTISLYPINANLTSGTVSGYLGDFFAEEKGLSIDVWAYSDEKTNAILASGDLPDIMHVTSENLSIMIDAGMVLQLDDYIDKLPHLQDGIERNKLQPALEFVRKYRSNDTGNLYALPVGVGSGEYTDNADRNVVHINWDIYEEIGAPAINSYDDLIDVAKRMMEAHPTDENGVKIYGTVLNSGSDTTYWGNSTLWLRWHGYTENQLPYLLEADMINGVYSSILEDNSMFYQSVKFYYDCMQAGILDPDSINTDRSTAGQKVRMFGGGTQPGWRPTYYEYWIPGTTYYLNSNTIYGDSVFGDTNDYIVVSANTRNLDACLEFLDMMCDTNAQIYTQAGPEGDMYQIDGNVLTLTEKAKEYYASNTGDGYYYDNGERAYLWNTGWVFSGGAGLTTYVDADGNALASLHTSWPEEIAITSNNDMYNRWKATTGYSSWHDLVETNDIRIYTSSLDYINSFLSNPDDSMKLTMSAINDTVVDACWKMVYAEDEATFTNIWNQMVQDCYDLGAEDLIAWRLSDIEVARAERDSVLGTAE